MTDKTPNAGHRISDYDLQRCEKFLEMMHQNFLNTIKREYSDLIADLKDARKELANLKERNATLEVALVDAVDGMACCVDDMNHCLEYSCVPTKDECASAMSYLGDAREALTPRSTG